MGGLMANFGGSSPAGSAGPTLSRGSRGEDVRRLQRELNQQLGGNLKVDGILGPRTEAAIRQLQQQRNIQVDGIAGPQTWGAIGGGSGQSPANQSGNTSNSNAGGGSVSPTNGTNTNPSNGNSSGGQGSVNHPPANATPAERTAHYTNMLRQQGVEVQPGQTYVVGLRGLSPSGQRTESTTNGNHLRAQNEQGNRYNDSFVVLSPGENGQHSVQVIRGATYPGQSRSTQSPDSNGDGVGDVGMIRPGTYQVRPNGNHRGSASYHVRNENGGGRLAGWRDTNHDGNYSASERARSEQNGDTLSAVLFHAGNDTRARSIGCQTMAPDDYQNFIEAVGGRRGSFSYTLIDANQGQGQ